MDLMRLEIDDLRQKLDDTDEIMTMLRSVSEPRSIDLLKGLRSAPTVLAFVDQVGSRKSSGAREGRVPSPGKSTTSSHSSCQPPLQSSLEFELMMRHAIAYPTLFPVEAARIDVQKLSDSTKPSTHVPYEKRKQS